MLSDYWHYFKWNKLFIVQVRVETYYFDRYRQGTATALNEIHPDPNISRVTVIKLLQKLQRTSSVVNECKSGDPSTDQAIEKYFGSFFYASLTIGKSWS